MSARRPRPSGPARAAIAFGLVAGFVAAVELARRIGVGPLLDRDPSWAGPRLALGLAGLAAAAAVGGIGAAAFLVWSRSRLAGAPLSPLPLGAAVLAALALSAFAAGAAARVLWIGRLPIPFLEDEVNLVPVSLALTGGPSDFADAIRPIPYGRPDPHEMIGVLYLELLRGSLRAFGATVTGLRFPGLLAGCVSLATAGLLGRALLPSGGGALTVLALAGLRWHVILSLSGWHSMMLVPLCDVAALLVLEARRRDRTLLAAAGGAVIGIGAHFYLASWAAAAALAAFAAWPVPGAVRRERAGRLVAFAAGMLIVAAPLFVLREGRRTSYFGRTSRYSIARELEYQKSPLPALGAAADAFEAPWFLPDPEARHDLEKASRLGILGIPVAIALARALVAPGDELSGYLLAHAGAALAAAVAGGTAGHPNGFRFGYLTSAAAVAAAAGTLALVGLAAGTRRRAAALAAIGAIAVAGAVGLEQALVEWPGRRATFDSFHGEDTLMGLAAARWARYGELGVAPGLGRSAMTIDTVRRYDLGFDPAGRIADLPPGGAEGRSFRVAAPAAAADAGERVVERVRDGWGRSWAVVLGRRRPAP